MNLKKIISIFLGFIALAVIILGLVFLTKNWPKFRLTSEQRVLQEISKEAGIGKFEMVGVVISAADDGKEITCRIESGSKTIEQYKNKETKIQISDVIQIYNKDGKQIKINDIKPEVPIRIRGTIDNNKLIAELIVLS